MMKPWPRLLVLVLSLLPAGPAIAQVAPEKAADTFRVADGLEFSLWASEPLLVNPACIDVDPKGRVWVCESVNYRTRLQRRPPVRREGDRILILEDTTGAGKADKVTVFYQSPELLAPLGIAVAKAPSGPGYRVFVCQSPDVLVFEDKNGDGKADGPPRKLLTGFGGIDHDHGVHGIQIGADGRLYFSVGDQGVSNLQGTDRKGRRWTSNDTDCRAGTLWRCDLDGRNLELIAHNFRNPCRPSVDSFGALFVCDSDDSRQTRLCQVLPGGDFGYQPQVPGQTPWNEDRPGVVPGLLATGPGLPASLCAYEGRLLPKQYQGQLLCADAAAGQVRCYRLTPRGAGHAVEREDVVTSTDKWFRPSDLCVAPDGSVFVSDWYDPDIGHDMRDVTHGRLYRLAPKSNRPTVPKVDLESRDGLRAALASPAASVRYLAIARLAGLSLEEVKKVLEPAVKPKDDPYLRARAFWHLFSRKTQPLLTVATYCAAAIGEDPEPRMAPMAVRLIKEAHAVSPAQYEARFIQILYGLPAPARREALLMLRDTNATKARPLVKELALRHDGEDRIYLAAVGIAVGRQDRARRGVLLADFDKWFLEWDERIADLVWELQPPAAWPRAEARLTDGNAPAEQRARIVEILAAADDADSGRALLRAVRAGLPSEVRRKLADALKRSPAGKWMALRNAPEMAEAIKALLAQADSRVAGLILVGAAQKVDAAAEVAALARGRDEPEPVRLAAVRALGMLPVAASVEALQGLLTDESAALRTEAVRALGQLSQQRTTTTAATKLLQDLVRAADKDLALARTALETLAGIFAGARWLLDLHDRKELPKALEADAARLLRDTPFPSLRDRARRAFPPPQRDT
jgi:putative membrane-bound dehydrogenase-like protein